MRQSLLGMWRIGKDNKYPKIEPNKIICIAFTFFTKSTKTKTNRQGGFWNA